MNDLPPTPGSAGTRKRLLLVLALVILAAAGGGWWYWGASAPAGADPGKAEKGKSGAPTKGGGRFGVDPNRVQPVTAAAASKGDIRIVQTSLGTITALRTVTVKPRVDGPLLEVGFREGQLVKEGELLARIDPAPYQAAVDQAEGALARDMAMLANARNDVERYRSLIEKGMVSKQQMDATESLARQHEGTIKVDRAILDNAKLQLSYTRVTAPIAGRLGLRQVDAGNIVHTSDATGLVVITQVDPITVVFTIPQDALPRVIAQLRAEQVVEVEAWDRDQKMKLATGSLISTDNQVDIATGTLKLKARLPNPQALLFPNQFVNVRMVVDTRKDATLIPSAAIQRGPQGTVVFVVKDDGSVGLRPVVTGPTEGALVAIDSGLAPGERVVTDGLDRLREGAKVEVTQPAGSKGAPAGGGAPKGAGSQGGREEFKKRLESASPEERARMLEESKKRREASGK